MPSNLEVQIVSQLAPYILLIINLPIGEWAYIINVYLCPTSSAHSGAIAKDICWVELSNAVGNTLPGFPLLILGSFKAHIHLGFSPIVCAIRK